MVLVSTVMLLKKKQITYAGSKFTLRHDEGQTSFENGRMTLITKKCDLFLQLL